jgi:O-antigen ligase
MILMLLSADWMAAITVSSARHAGRFFRSIWWTMVLTVVAGLVVGLVLPDAVNWGHDRSPSFAQTVRAEFFFFYVLPHYGFALSLAIVLLTIRRPGVRFLVALGAAVLIPALAVLTQTRTMIFSMLLVALVFLFRYARKTFVLASAVVVLSLAWWPVAVANVADHLRVSSFVSADAEIDATTGRLVLVMINLQSFRDSPIFGQGAVETRSRVEASDSIAKSEHGYSLHLASSGLFSLLLFAYVIQGLVAAIRILLRREHGPRQPVVGPYALAIAALAMASFVTGFFWTFSSATAFYEWFAIFFVSAARVTSHMAWPPRRIALGSQLTARETRAV